MFDPIAGCIFCKRVILDDERFTTISSFELQKVSQACLGDEFISRVLHHAIYVRAPTPDAIRDEILLDREVHQSEYLFFPSSQNGDKAGASRQYISRIGIPLVGIEFRDVPGGDCQSVDNFVQSHWTSREAEPLQHSLNIVHEQLVDVD